MPQQKRKTQTSLQRFSPLRCTGRPRERKTGMLVRQIGSGWRGVVGLLQPTQRMHAHTPKKTAKPAYHEDPVDGNCTRKQPPRDAAHEAEHKGFPFHRYGHHGSALRGRGGPGEYLVCGKGKPKAAKGCKGNPAKLVGAVKVKDAGNQLCKATISQCK